MLVDFKPRLYQETILDTTRLNNTLVVLPTGLGKTAIALLLAEQRLSQYPHSKIVFFAPTKPLAEQHLETFQKYMKDREQVLFTGQISPKKRKELFKNSQIIFSTPQGFENDVLGSEINFKETSLIVFDEAHRATGNYSYSFLAKQYCKQADYPRILALTASPGSEIEKINEIVQNLFIEQIEIRTEQDPDVSDYVQEVKINWINVDLPEEFKKIKKYLDNCFKSKITELREKGYLKNFSQINKTDLIAFQKTLIMKVSKGEKDFDVLKSLSLLAESLKIYHAIELVETQGIIPLMYYFNKLLSEASLSKTQAAKNLVKDLNFKSALVLTQHAEEKKLEHPKTIRLKNFFETEFKENQKLILFSHFRDTASNLVDELSKIQGVKPVLFVGQSNKRNKGLTQKEQKQILEEFKQGTHNCLVATSVAEEGLDIPQVNHVIFYEPVASAIRQIQRRGRTGRLEKGEVSILVTRGTRDEGYRWSAHRKEKKMKSHLEELRRKIVLTNNHARNENKTLLEFQKKEEIKIFADYREKASPVLKELVELGVELKIETLQTSDFILSKRVAVEYKKVRDFVDSLVDGRLLAQLKSLKNQFERPIVIIEGEEDIFSQRKVHPNSINGMIATIAVSYGISLLKTKNFKETATLLLAIAKREQDEKLSSYSFHEKKPMSEKELQEYIVSSFPGIGSSLAKPILDKFKSIKNFINSSTDELKEVEKIGNKKAKTIKELIDKKYD